MSDVRIASTPWTSAIIAAVIIAMFLLSALLGNGQGQQCTVGMEKRGRLLLSCHEKEEG